MPLRTKPTASLSLGALIAGLGLLDTLLILDTLVSGGERVQALLGGIGRLFGT